MPSWYLMECDAGLRAVTLPVDLVMTPIEFSHGIQSKNPAVSIRGITVCDTDSGSLVRWYYNDQSRLSQYSPRAPLIPISSKLAHPFHPSLSKDVKTRCQDKVDLKAGSYIMPVHVTHRLDISNLQTSEVIVNRPIRIQILKRLSNLVILPYRVDLRERASERTTSRLPTTIDNQSSIDNHQDAEI